MAAWQFFGDDTLTGLLFLLLERVLECVLEVLLMVTSCYLNTTTPHTVDSCLVLGEPQLFFF